MVNRGLSSMTRIVNAILLASGSLGRELELVCVSLLSLYGDFREDVQPDDCFCACYISQARRGNFANLGHIIEWGASVVLLCFARNAN